MNNEKLSIGVIICAAGKGSRTGFEKNKLLVPFQGATALQKTVAAFQFPAVNEILITVSAQDEQEICRLFAENPQIKTVLGGETRTQSVYNALKASSADIVLIHDGARPFVTRESIENCIHSVKTYGSGVCAIECRDTIAVVQDGKIVQVPARSTLRQIQTPQGFFRENILYAYERAFEREKTDYTDDSSLFADYCGLPRICEGSRENVKLTYAEDLTGATERCGFGIDTHAFGKEQDFIVLGGVKIPSHSGLIAHSDGDVLTHAVMDALLSAAGLKDIGHYFPDTDEKWKGANSMEMLCQVLSLLQEQGLGVKNLSVAIQAEKPRLAKFIDEIQNSLAGALKIDPTCVGISAGTNEGLGYVGEGKGITVNAYVLLKKVK